MGSIGKRPLIGGERMEPVTTREMTPDEIGRLTLVVNGFELLDARPADYHEHGISPQVMEKVGPVIGKAIMRRFNDVKLAHNVLRALAAGDLNKDVFNVGEAEVRVPEVDERIVKKVGRYIIGAIHRSLKGPDFRSGFSKALAEHARKVRDNAVAQSIGGAR